LLNAQVSVDACISRSSSKVLVLSVWNVLRYTTFQCATYHGSLVFVTLAVNLEGNT
jgi:hypothetical protein